MATEPSWFHTVNESGLPLSRLGGNAEPGPVRERGPYLRGLFAWPGVVPLVYHGVGRLPGRRPVRAGSRHGGGALGGDESFAADATMARIGCGLSRRRHPLFEYRRSPDQWRRSPRRRQWHGLGDRTVPRGRVRPAGRRRRPGDRQGRGRPPAGRAGPSGGRRARRGPGRRRPQLVPVPAWRRRPRGLAGGWRARRGRLAGVAAVAGRAGRRQAGAAGGAWHAAGAIGADSAARQDKGPPRSARRRRGARAHAGQAPAGQRSAGGAGSRPGVPDPAAARSGRALMATRSALSRPGFRDLVIGQAVSSFGDWMGTVALMALVLDLTGSATAVGGILVLRLLPAGFAGPIAAGVAERWDRRRIMLTCDLARAGLVALIPLVRAAWWVYLWAFLLEVANLVFLPARDASIPDLVDEHELPTANGIVLGSSYGNIPVGAGAFALLTLVPTSWNGYLDSHQGALPLWLDGATYLVSYAFIRRLSVLGPSRVAAGAGPRDGGRRGIWSGVVAALRLPIVRAVLPATITAVIGVGALFSLGVVFVREVLHASTAQFGVMVALFGAAAAAALVASITYLQETLSGEDRLLGLTVYHIVFRVGLSVAAIGGGLAAQAFGPARLPVLGTMQPPALVLLSAGVVMVLGAALMPTSVAVPGAAEVVAGRSGAARLRRGRRGDDREAAR